MKKLLAVTLIALLSFCLLWGCSNNTDAENKDIPLYFYLDRGTEVTPDASGEYAVDFALNGEKKTFKLTDKAMLDQLKYLDFVGLTLENDKIVGFTRMIDMPYTRLALDYYVSSIGGNKVKLSGPENYEVLDLLIELPENLPVYDFTSQSTAPGAQTTLLKNDCVSIVADEAGTPLLCYVTARPSVPHEGKQYCQHCDSEVSWQDWLATNKLPVSTGHFILSNDVTVIDQTTIGAGNICLDLNGKTVTQAAFGKRIYRLAGSAVLSIMDSAGSGAFVPNSTDGTNGTDISGMGIYLDSYDAVLNFHSGTIDASKTVASYGNALYMNAGTINIYGGTILGGSSYGAGGCAISAKGNLNIYGGKLVGGTCIDATYNYPIGGAALRVLGVTTIYGGEIIGGETDTVGGAIRVCGDAFGGAKLILKGGTITGGKAPVGGAIYISSASELVLSGNTKITGNETGNICLADGAIVSIGDEGMAEGAEIGLYAEGSSVSILGVPEGTDLSKYFFCDMASQTLTDQGNGCWIIK